MVFLIGIATFSLLYLEITVSGEHVLKYEKAHYGFLVFFVCFSFSLFLFSTFHHYLFTLLTFPQNFTKNSAPEMLSYLSCVPKPAAFSFAFLLQLYVSIFPLYSHFSLSLSLPGHCPTCYLILLTICKSMSQLNEVLVTSQMRIWNEASAEHALLDCGHSR